MKSKEQLMKLDKTITFWKGFASGFATAVIGVAGLVALINYLVQITQAVKSWWSRILRCKRRSFTAF